MVSTLRGRCVYDGHRTLVPDISVCVRVVSRDSIGEFLTWAKISGVDLPPLILSMPMYMHQHLRNRNRTYNQISKWGYTLQQLDHFLFLLDIYSFFYFIFSAFHFSITFQHFHFSFLTSQHIFIFYYNSTQDAYYVVLLQMCTRAHTKPGTITL